LRQPKAVPRPLAKNPYELAHSCATVQAVDKAASPAPVLISGNKTLRMAMI
jgi:hypothetical protein